MDDKIVLPEKVEKSLTVTEKDAYVRYVGANRPPLSPKTSADLYELFLNGSTCEEIAKLNPGLGLGIIVRARIDFKWDDQKEQYLSNLFSTIRERATKSQLEAIDFSATAMSVYRKLWDTKFKKFLQTGNEDDLGEFKGMSFKIYKEFSEALMKLTGQDKKQQQIVSGEVVHKVEGIDTTRKITPKEAASVLKTINADFTKKE